MTGPAAQPAMHVAATLRQALDALADFGADAAPFAGGTWIMRAPLRHEAMKPAYVALGRVAELGRVEVDDREVRIGAVVTHARLAEALAGLPELGALREAAARSANPAVRGAATIGGNLATVGFPAADLVSALLCLDAEVRIDDRNEAERMPLGRFLAIRHDFAPGRVLTSVVVPRGPARSAHVRLPLRKAGDYPVAIVSLAAELDGAGRLRNARVAVGSVEATARRWSALEEVLEGQPLDPDRMADEAKVRGGDFAGRDGVEAPGWYRVAVLPALLRRAATALAAT